MTILAIDVGNTRAKFGLWRSSDSATDVAWRLTAIPLKPGIDLPGELQQWLTAIKAPQVESVIVAGSNPHPVQQLKTSRFADAHQIWHVESYEQLPLKMAVRNPETVGIDRLLTAVAVRAQQSSECSVIVVDAGTATTVNLTTADGTFHGGAILPGMRMSARALHEYTAVLPLVDADGLVNERGDSSKFPTMPGNDTTAAIENGLFWGHLGSLKELIQRLKERLPELADNTAPRIAMTGGGGRQLAGFIEGATYHDSLALTGLAVIGAGDNLG